MGDVKRAKQQLDAGTCFQTLTSFLSKKCLGFANTVQYIPAQRATQIFNPRVLLSHLFVAQVITQYQGLLYMPPLHPRNNSRKKQPFNTIQMKLYDVPLLLPHMRQFSLAPHLRSLNRQSIKICSQLILFAQLDEVNSRTPDLPASVRVVVPVNFLKHFASYVSIFS